MKEIIEKNNQEKQPNNWYLDIPTPNDGIKYTNGTEETLIKNLRIEVIHGTEKVFGTNWIALVGKLDDERDIDLGGYRIKNGEFYSLPGDKVNTQDNINKPIFDKLEKYLKENPKDLEKINKELIVKNY